MQGDKTLNQIIELTARIRELKNRTVFYLHQYTVNV